MRCVEYSMEPHEWGKHKTPCKCPICGGFLKWEGNIPICNKCRTELIMLPEVEDGFEMDWGKICPISLPQSSAPKVKTEVDV